MDPRLKDIIWQQLGASFDVLGDAIDACPDELWTATVYSDSDDARYGEFWFVAFHALRWTDNYTEGVSVEDFQLPAPFIKWALPNEPYKKSEVRTYFAACRQKGHDAIEGLTNERACQAGTNGRPYLDLHIGNIRHLAEHSAQLNLLLAENGVCTDRGCPDWVGNTQS